MPTINFLTAHQLAQMIRTGKISSYELVQACLQQIERHNPKLNAIVTLNAENALGRAHNADNALRTGDIWGQLHGVPFTVKDTFETARLRTTASHRPLANYIPENDASAVARLRQAGAILLGKTNLPELALDVQTNSPLFGRTNNPWDVRCTPGGSTGGGAVAVAAGFTPLELGSDIGGSLRIPAHYCGVFAFKPSEHRVPDTGHIPELPGQPKAIRHLGTFGPMARSVDDLHLALSLIAGADGVDREAPPVPLDSSHDHPLRDLRLAWCDQFDGAPVSHEIRKAIEKLANNLASQGCRVERLTPPGFDFNQAWETYGELMGAMLSTGVPYLLRFLGRWFGWIAFSNTPIYRAMQRAMFTDMLRFSRILTRRDALATALENFLQHWDAWLLPVSSTPAFTHRWSSLYFPGSNIQVDKKSIPYWNATLSYTTPFNLTGSPVAVLPIGHTSQGLPIGVQVVGRRWRDMALLAVAARISEVTAPFKAPPGYGG